MCVRVCVCVTGNNSSSISCLSFCSIISFLFASACANVQWWSTHTDTHSHCWDVSIEVALMWGFFALDEIEIEGWSEKETGGLSRNTVLLFLLRDARETSLCCNPPLPTHRKSTQSGTVHFVLVSPGWTVPFDSMRCKEGRGGKRAVTKKHKGGEKLGGIADSTLRG